MSDLRGKKYILFYGYQNVEELTIDKAEEIARKDLETTLLGDFSASFGRSVEGIDKKAFTQVIGFRTAHANKKDDGFHFTIVYNVPSNPELKEVAEYRIGFSGEILGRDIPFFDKK